MRIVRPAARTQAARLELTQLAACGSARAHSTRRARRTAKVDVDPRVQPGDHDPSDSLRRTVTKTVAAEHRQANPCLTIGNIGLGPNGAIGAISGASWGLAQIVAPGSADAEGVAGFLDVAEQETSIWREAGSGHLAVDVATLSVLFLHDEVARDRLCAGGG
jgi:hypothetical protein